MRMGVNINHACNICSGLRVNVCSSRIPFGRKYKIQCNGCFAESEVKRSEAEAYKDWIEHHAHSLVRPITPSPYNSRVYIKGKDSSFPGARCVPCNLNKLRVIDIIREAQNDVTHREHWLLLGSVLVRLEDIDYAVIDDEKIEVGE